MSLTTEILWFINMHNEILISRRSFKLTKNKKHRDLIMKNQKEMIKNIYKRLEGKATPNTIEEIISKMTFIKG